MGSNAEWGGMKGGGKQMDVSGWVPKSKTICIKREYITETLLLFSEPEGTQYLYALYPFGAFKDKGGIIPLSRHTQTVSDFVKM
ncbi:hypothetical protein BaRGS_00002027 [Batillaria attramentaria]|uniref:Uncharacterized protein n=1 Tax=Batillaria attramentaria TaxID=370345 RepID=A0ABD0M4M4_9CAEN